jgi:phage terminase large subunit-like protein
LAGKLDTWQQTDFAALDQGWQAAAGQQSTGVLRAWLERPRGHSKTSDLAVMAAWALFASRHRISGYGSAADAEQAKLLRDSVDRLVRLNPWLGQILTVKANAVVNGHTGSTLEILSSDAPTSYGLLPDFVIVDELCHWKKPDLWESLISSAAKRRNCMLVIITNAGFGESWQWGVRESVRQDEAWYFSRLDGPQASWITEGNLAEQRRLLPDIAYRRWWLNEWTSGCGAAWADADSDAALTQRESLQKAEQGWVYVAGLDLGLQRDKAALAVVGRHVGYYEAREQPVSLTPTQALMVDAGLWEEPEPELFEQYTEGTGRLKLACLYVWNPADALNGKVDIEEIEETIWELDRRFKLQVGADPWQAAYLIERLQKRGVPIEPVNFSGQNLTSMCSATLEAFNEANIDLYPEPHLLHDLRNLKVVEKSYGVRLDSPRGLNGHGDCATALSIALHITKTRNTIAQTSINRKLIAYP